MDKVVRFTARLHLLPSSQSGRDRLIRNGYTTWWIGHTAGQHKTFNDAYVTIEGDDEVAPGESTMVHLAPLLYDHWRHLEVDEEIELWEGFSKKIGTAQVLGIEYSE